MLCDGAISSNHRDHAARGRLRNSQRQMIWIWGTPNTLRSGVYTGVLASSSDMVHPHRQTLSHPALCGCLVHVTRSCTASTICKANVTVDQLPYMFLSWAGLSTSMPHSTPINALNHNTHTTPRSVVALHQMERQPLYAHIHAFHPDACQCTHNIPRCLRDAHHTCSPSCACYAHNPVCNKSHPLLQCSVPQHRSLWHPASPLPSRSCHSASQQAMLSTRCSGPWKCHSGPRTP